MIPSKTGMMVYHAIQKGKAAMFGCIFCQVATREKRATVLFEDDLCVAIQDIHPQAPVHLLVIPRKHVGSLNDDAEAQEPLLGHLLAVAAKMARMKGIDGTGYRTVINTNAEGGQTVYHLHVHVLGGRPMKWPPG
jgi:histidine triad (HIT) family protein